jgi:hypothetical protein
MPELNDAEPEPIVTATGLDYLEGRLADAHDFVHATATEFEGNADSDAFLKWDALYDMLTDCLQELSDLRQWHKDRGD